MLNLKKIALKNTLLMCLLCTGIAVHAQDQSEEKVAEQTSEEEPKEGWTSKGIFTFLFNQTAFSNWLAGGQNSIGGNVSINYDFDYLRGQWSWDNKIISSYGLTKTEGIDLRKTDDRFEWNSLLGKKTSGYWSYSFIVNFKTQFTDGYNYKNDPGGAFRNSGFLGPAYLVFGPGMKWKKSNNFKFNIAPATSKMTFLGQEVFIYDQDMDTFVSSNDRTAFGVAPGDTLRYELGFFALGYFKFNLMENVIVENIINLYANYLEDFLNVDIDYQLNIAMQINKYISTNVAFQTIYDDNAFGGFQIREVFGLGLNYNF